MFRYHLEIWRSYIHTWVSVYDSYDVFQVQDRYFIEKDKFPNKIYRIIKILQIDDFE